MPISRRFFLAQVTAAAALPLPAVAAGGGRIGISLPANSVPWNSDAAIMTKAFQTAGYTPDAEFAGNDMPTQLSQLQDMISAGVRALVIAPVDGTALTAALANAAAANIRIFDYDLPITRTRDLDYYVGFDNFQVGVEQARSLAKVLQHRFPGRRPWKVELFAGAPGDPAARQYFDGAISVLRPMMASGTIAVPSGQTSFAACATMGGNSAVAQVRMDNLLAGYYGNARIDGALSPDDHLSGGIIASLTGVGYGADVLKMPIVTGLGCGIAAVRQIIAGKLWSSIFKDSRVLARATGKLVDRVLSGGPAATGGAHYDNGSEKVPALLMNPVAVDATNWKRLLVASGYYRITQLQ